MKIEFKGKTIDVSEGKMRYWKMDAEYHKRVRDAETHFKEAYKKTGNLKNLVEKFWDIVEFVEDESYSMIESMLKTYGDISYSSDEFYDTFIKRIDNAFEKYDKELSEEYFKLLGNKEAQYQYRRDRKANRRKWYGITQQGQNKAAIKNMESYLWHSTKNAVGNTVTATATSIKMASVFNDKNRMSLMCAEIKTLYSEIRNTMYLIMQKESRYPFQVITNTDATNANILLENAKQFEINSEENIVAIIDALETHPGLSVTYQYIIENYGDKDKKFETLASKCGISLLSWKTSKLKEKLKECTPIDLSDEDKILNAIEIVENQCEFWGIDSTEYTKDLRGKWTILDKKLRTIENVEYQTREEAGLAKHDLKYLEKYSAHNNMLDTDIELLSTAVLPELECGAIKDNIEYHLNMLKEAQDIRNIQKAAKQIMSYFTAYEKIQKCFAYGHIFSQKVGYERFKELFTDNQKVALIYDTAAINKGINGLLLTNSTLYYYQEQRIKGIQLVDYEGMQVREGKIFIQIRDEEELNTGLAVNVDQLDYNFFAEAFDKVVNMCRSIKNADLEIKDEDVYDNVVVRSKQAEFVRHNKLLVIVVAAVIVFILAIIGVNTASGKKDEVASQNIEQKEFTEEVTETPEESETTVENEFVEMIVPVDTTYDWNIYYGDEIISFLNHEITCWYVNDNSVCGLEDIILGLEDSEEIFATGYALVDMDSDAKPEVVVNLSGNLDDYYLIIHYNDESNDSSIYVKTCGLRSMQMLQVNGVYSGSSGASSYGYYILNFEPEMNVYETQLAYTDGENYYVQSTQTSEEEFNDYCQELEADWVTWTEYSLSYLAEDLGTSFTEEYLSYETGEYILSGSSDYLLDWSELEGLTAEECKIARNEIYARHGRIFNDEELQAYFESCSWYEGYISGEDFSEDMLSDVEMANRDLIVEYETEMGYR